MLATGGEHLDALLASFKREQLKREQLLRQCELSPPEQPSSSSVVAEQWPSCALAEPQNLAVEAATVPRQQQLRGVLVALEVDPGLAARPVRRRP